MPPFLALTLCAIFVWWLFKQEREWRGPMPGALWIPLCWLLHYGSRPIANWLSGGTLAAQGGNVLEGSPVDRFTDFCLIAIAFIIVQRRVQDWGNVFAKNAPLFLLTAYLLMSVTWSVEPFVAFKRWFKEFGSLFVIMVILTEEDPVGAVRMLFLRAAYLLLPLSIVLIKYYPAFGRSYSVSGEYMATGVTTQKNSLGEICCIFNLILIWELTELFKQRNDPRTRPHLYANAMVLGMGTWLLLTCNSKTSLVSLLIGAAIFFSSKLQFVRARPAAFARACFIGIAIYLMALPVWTMAMAPILKAMGRDPGLTGRTKIWEVILDQHTNPMFGTGFYSFWLEKGEAVWEEMKPMRINTGHSGYIEMYLDGGMIGCTLMMIMIITACLRTAKNFSADGPASRLFLALPIMALNSNYSETIFYRLSPLWFAFLACTIWVRPPPTEIVVEPAQEEAAPA